jgi:CBS-domain-containing membrane protein
MWEYECGALPVLNDRGDPIAMVTDRDICMAAYTQGKKLSEIPVIDAASRHLRSVRPDDSAEFALSVMRDHAVRRLPVVDIGGNLVGIVSLVDFARAKVAGEPIAREHFEQVTTSLAEVCRPHSVRP